MIAFIMLLYQNPICGTYTSYIKNNCYNYDKNNQNFPSW